MRCVVQTETKSALERWRHGDQEFTVFLPLSHTASIESNPHVRVKRFPRLQTVVLTELHPGSAWNFQKLVSVFLCPGTRFVLQDFPECLVIIIIIIININSMRGGAPT